MDKVSYEQVNAENELHAKIAYLDEALFHSKRATTKLNYVPAHWHRSIEFSLVCKGEVELWINNQKSIIKEGEFIFVNSGQIHKLARPSNIPTEVLLVLIPYEFLKKAVPSIDEMRFDIHKDIPQKQRLYEIYEHFITYAKKPQQNDELMINAYVYELLYILLQYFQIEGSSEKKSRTGKKQQHQVLNYIEDHYAENLSLAHLADLTHMSEEHFSRSFHENFGMNFKTYLTNYRLYCCHSEVLESDKSMQQIALDHGFSSVKTFINAFKEGYGMTPYQYRKQNKISKKGNFSIK